MASKRVSPQEG